jgi:hypothetical protein
MIVLKVIESGLYISMKLKIVLFTPKSDAIKTGANKTLIIKFCLRTIQRQFSNKNKSQELQGEIVVLNPFVIQ